MPPRLLVEAGPGAGKTTAFRTLAALLREAGVPLAGFTTAEVRVEGRRTGFEVESFDGRRELLAGVELSGPPRVGRYGVDLEAFERVALPALEVPPGGVVVIDELGKMELASEPFREALEQLLEAPVPIAATVHVARHPFTERLKRRRDVELIRLTAANRDELSRTLAAKLLEKRG